MPRKKRLSAKHKRNISRSLIKRNRGRKKNDEERSKLQPSQTKELLSNAESASKIVRNLALSAETPSKIARNASVTAKNLSNVSYGIDRNLKRVGRITGSAENLSKAFYRRNNYLLGVDRLLANKKRFGL